MADLEAKWRDLDASMRPALLGAGGTIEAVDWMIADARSRIFEMWMATTESVLIADPALRAQVDAVVERNSTLYMGHLFRIERELYEARFRKSAMTKDALRDLAVKKAPLEEEYKLS